MNLRSIRDVVMIVALALAGVAAGYVGMGVFGHSARAASFDCAKAASPSELAICANPTLSALDSQLGAAYALRIAAAPEVRDLERAWLKVRNVGCGKDAACLTRMTHAQVAWLRSGAAMSAALPRTPGTCSLSRIQQVGTRLGDGTQPVGNDYGSGSAVIEANKAMQVFYDQIPDIDHSRRRRSGAGLPDRLAARLPA